MDIDDKIHENRIRRMAKRQGLTLTKSRRRDPRAYDFGCYVLIDPFTNAIVYGATSGRFDLSLEEVEAYLTEDDAS